MTEVKVMTPKEYAKHLKDFCGLKDEEIKMVLTNVFKKIQKEELMGSIKGGKKWQKETKVLQK